MSRPTILVNGLRPPPLGDEANGVLTLDEAASLTLESLTGITSVVWEFELTPEGSTCAPASPTSTSTSCTPDLPGEYVLTCRSQSGRRDRVVLRAYTAARSLLITQPTDPTTTLHDAVNRTTRAVDAIVATASTTQHVQSMAALRASTPETNGAAILAGRTSRGDGGGGVFFHDPSDTTSTDDGALTVVTSGGARLKRVYSGPVDVRWFGAKGDGVTNDRDAVYNAITAASTAGAAVYFPPGTYIIGSSITLPANAALTGDSQLESIIQCGFDGTLFVCDDDNRFMHLTFDGQGATYTSSKLFTVAGTKARQRWWDCALINAGSYCVEFVDETAGSQSTMLDCRVYRYNGSAAGRYAIKIKDTGIVTAVPRKFIGCESDGGKFIDLGGCNNVYIGGGYIAGVLFSSNSRGVWMNGVRLADPAGANLAGYNHSLTGCDIAGPGITIESGTSACKVASTFNAANPVTDNSGQGGANMVDIPTTTFTPTVTSSGAAVTLGSGADVRGQFSRSGAMVHVDIELTWGTGLSVPSGFLEFSLPSSITPRSATIQAPCGSGYTQQGASTKLLHAVAFPGVSHLRALTEGGGYITNINPWSWASGNIIRLSITYTL